MTTRQENPKSLWGPHLFVPGNNAGFLTKLPLIDVQNIIIDLEYSTKLPNKVDGRFLAKNAIAYLRQVRPDISICVRVNLFKTERLFENDMDVISRGLPDAIRIPSVNTAEEIVRADAILTDAENRLEVPQGTVKLHVMIETPMGLKNASEILAASPRVTSAGLGGEDWAYNCGLERTRTGEELDYVKHELVSIASQCGVVPIDTVFLWLDDFDGLEQDSRRSFQIGMKGRATTNPRQLSLINEIYVPSETKILWAESILSDLEEVELYGVKHQVVHGVISDPLAVNYAREILNRRDTVPNNELKLIAGAT